MSFTNTTPTWIWFPDLKNSMNFEKMDRNLYFDIIHNFDITSLDLNKEIYIDISVDSQYILWINGFQVSFGQFPDYPHYKIFDTILISPFLKNGENRLSILAYYIGEDSSTYFKGAPGITFDLHDSHQAISSCTSNTFIRPSLDYKSGVVEKISPQLSYTCYYNAALHDGWNKQEYVAGNEWLTPMVLGARGLLYPRPIKKVVVQKPARSLLQSQGIFINPTISYQSTIAESMQFSFLSFRESRNLCGLSSHQELPFEAGIKFKTELEAKCDGIYFVLDLEQEQTGHIHFDIETVPETIINISYGEHLEDLRVRSHVGGRNFAMQYITKGGREQWIDLIRRVGCRYIQVHVYSNEFKLYYFGLQPAIFPVIIKNQYKAANELHQKIYDTGIRTLELCMHDHYEDCPWREQALYSMDSRNQMLSGYYCFDNDDFAKTSLRLLAYSQRSDGLLELCAPARIPITIPCFSLTFIIQLCEYVDHSRDIDFGREMFDIAKRVMDVFIEKIRSNGLVSCFVDTQYWNFYEWSNDLDGGDIFRNDKSSETFDGPLNAFLSIALQNFSQLCESIEKKDLSILYKDLYIKLNKSMDTCFWDSDNNLYYSFLNSTKPIKFSELTQSLFVYCKAARNERKDAILEAMSKSGSNLIPVTLSHSIFKYEAFLMEKQKYHTFVLSQIASIWGNMLFQGATTFWETEKGSWDFDNGGSLCHGWSAIPVYLYHKYGDK